MSRGKSNPKDDEMRGRTVTHDHDDDDGRELLPPSTLLGDAYNIGAWIADDGQEVAITVTRQATQHRGREEFVMRCNSSDYTPDSLLEYIQRTFGGGDYRIKGYVAGRMVFNQAHTIAAPAAPKTENVPAPRTDALDVATMVKQMQLQMVEQQLNAQRQMSEMMSGMMQTLGVALKPPPPVDQMQMMQSMMAMLGAAREMFAPAQTATQAEPMGIINVALQLAEKLGGSGDKETNTNDVLMSLLNVAGKALPQMIAQNKPAPGAAAAIPRPPMPQKVPAITAPAPVASAPATAPAPARRGVLQQAAEKIDALRIMGIAPDQAADMISEALPDDDWLRLQNFLHRDNWYDLLAQSVPAAKLAPDWWQSVRESLRAAVDDLTPDDESAKTAGEQTPESAADASPAPRPVS